MIHLILRFEASPLLTTNEFGAAFQKNVLENEQGDVKDGIFVNSKFSAHYFFRTGQTDI